MPHPAAMVYYVTTGTARLLHTCARLARLYQLPVPHAVGRQAAEQSRPPSSARCRAPRHRALALLQASLGPGRAWPLCSSLSLFV